MKKTFKVTQLEELPRVPGVYSYYDRRGQLLYVGKATSLKSRVNSYWQRPTDDRIAQMVTKIHEIRIQPTDSALEALILEANEIQRHQPPYNVRGKDSKTFAQIALTKELYPRFLIIRPTNKVNFEIERTFGPYVSAYAARRALKSLQEMFKFKCSNQISKPRLKHLRGGGGAKGDGISSKVKEAQEVTGRSCLYRELGSCPGICTGEITPVEYKKTIRRVVQFLEGKKDRIIKTTEKLMTEAAKRKEYERAARYRDELFALTHIRDTAFMTDDATSLLESSLPERLEAYDISNIGKDAAVGSMVVLEQGRPNPAEYRMFKIRSVGTQNDLAMLREILTRRLRHNEWPKPEFILVDGGKTQLQVAERLLKRYKLNIPVAGVIKGPQRKLAKLVLGDNSRSWLKEKRLTTQVFEPIVRLARDEAHRFAINYHRKVRSKTNHKSGF